jgi:ubiquinone/menaquinone biosynthesis C-methylase UbiE
MLGKHVSPRATILDVGCGTGWMSETLSRQGYRVTGLDLHPDGLRATRRAIPDAMLVQGEAHHLPLEDGSWEAAILLDILEHVDDRAVLRELRRVLRPAGAAIITVPALPWLWSHRDEIAGHRRRYTRRQLRQLITESGLELREMRYYQFFLLPLVLVARVFGKRSPELCQLEERPLPVLNRALTWINRFEVSLGELIPWPWGSSLVVVCCKT